MHKFLAPSDYPLWFLNIIAQVILFIPLVRYRTAPRILILRYYLAFLTLYSLSMLPIAFCLKWQFYSHVFWAAQGICVLFQIGLAIHLMATLKVGTSEWRVALRWIAIIMVTTVFMESWGKLNWVSWLNVLRWSDSAVWFVLLLSIVFAQRWSWPYKGIAIGLAGYVGLHFALAFIQGDHAPGPALRVMYQAASLYQLLVWFYTIKTSKRLQAMMATV